MEIHMKKLGMSAVAAALLGGAMLLPGSSPAAAMSLPGGAVASPGAHSMVEEVGRHRRSDRRARRYDRRRHGARYRYRRPGFHYQYGGYYYANPWWMAAPSIGFGVTIPVAPVGSPHVDWCLSNFRSYDIATDTYLGFDGYRHRCNSPFR